MQETITTRSQDLLAESVNTAIEENSSATDTVESLIEAAYKEFLNKKLDDFPRMCEVARIQNKIRMDDLKETGNTGSFTDSHGWSNGKEFFWEFSIPNDLYAFMQNMVYKKFWANGNKRIYRAFMNAICRGDDPMTTLIKVKQIYGPNSDRSLT